MTDQDGITHPPAEIAQADCCRLHPEHYIILAIIAGAFALAIAGMAR